MTGSNNAAIDETSRQKAAAQAFALAGDSASAARAWGEVLRLAPNDRKARNALTQLLVGLDRLTEALPHVRAMAAEDPRSPKLRRLLARCLEATGELDEAIDAWRQAIRLGLEPAKASASVATLLKTKGALAELKALAKARPHNPAVWTSLAEARLEAGAIEDAMEAFEHVVRLSPGALEAHDQLDRWGRARRGEPPALRVVVFGNCQAYGVAQSLRRLLPDADVDCRPTIAPPSPSEVDAADLVVGQPVEDPRHPLSQTRLGALGRRFVAIPRIAFTGFHPDLFHSELKDKLPRFRAFHSRIIAGAFLLGTPRDRVADLFNAYVYGALGYFDEFAKAERFLIDSSPDLDLGPAITAWRKDVFVHVPDHPKIGVLHAIAAMACRKAGLEPQDAAPGPDHQATRTVWAVYPEIARRLGVAGSLSVQPDIRVAPMDLEALIGAFYEHYAAGGSAALIHPRALEARDILEREGV